MEKVYRLISRGVATVDHAISRSFAHGFWRGLAAPAELYGSQALRHRPVPSATAALRSDWDKIGNDFRSVIAREHGRPTITTDRPD